MRQLVILSAVSSLLAPAQADVGLLYGALALAGVSVELQNLARMIPTEHTRSLNCFAANRIGHSLQNLESFTNIGVQQFKISPMNIVDDWDRLLYGLLEGSRIELESQCRDIHVDPNLCEAIQTLGDTYIRKRICTEIHDLDWRQSRCPSEPMPTSNPFSPSRLPFSFAPQWSSQRAGRTFDNDRPDPARHNFPSPVVTSMLQNPRSSRPTEQHTLMREAGGPSLKEFDLFAVEHL